MFGNLTETQVAEIADECREYASRYNCKLYEALADWEGDGPEGSWGLTTAQRNQVASYLALHGK